MTTFVLFVRPLLNRLLMRGSGMPLMVGGTIAVFDTSVLVDPPEDYSECASLVCVSAVSIGELAFGLYSSGPLEAGKREALYRGVLADYDPIPWLHTNTVQSLQRYAVQAAIHVPMPGI